MSVIRIDACLGTWQDAMVFVFTARVAHTAGMAGCHAKHQRPAVAKNKWQDAMLFVITESVA